MRLWIAAAVLLSGCAGTEASLSPFASGAGEPNLVYEGPYWRTSGVEAHACDVSTASVPEGFLQMEIDLTAECAPDVSFGIFGGIAGVEREGNAVALADTVQLASSADDDDPWWIFVTDVQWSTWAGVEPSTPGWSGVLSGAEIVLETHPPEIAVGSLTVGYGCLTAPVAMAVEWEGQTCTGSGTIVFSPVPAESGSGTVLGPVRDEE